jgi:hypothetical protein
MSRSHEMRGKRRRTRSESNEGYGQLALQERSGFVTPWVRMRTK